MLKIVVTARSSCLESSSFRSLIANAWNSYVRTFVWSACIMTLHNKNSRVWPQVSYFRQVFIKKAPSQCFILFLQPEMIEHYLGEFSITYKPVNICLFAVSMVGYCAVNVPALRPSLPHWWPNVPYVIFSRGKKEPLACGAVQQVSANSLALTEE